MVNWVHVFGGTSSGNLDFRECGVVAVESKAARKETLVLPSSRVSFGVESHGKLQGSCDDGGSVG